jgi:hypothetical protein
VSRINRAARIGATAGGIGADLYIVVFNPGTNYVRLALVHDATTIAEALRCGVLTPSALNESAPAIAYTRQ